MKIILIVMWSYSNSVGNSMTSQNIEFNNMEQCQQAAALIKRTTKPDVLVCAKKGLM